MKSIFIISFFTLLSTLTYSQIEINYPNINGQGKLSINYAILELALSKSGENFRINQLDYKVNDVVQRKMLSEGKIDVGDFGTSIEFEQNFLAVYFPIDLGLNGWRLLFIHKDNIERFSEVTDLTGLMKFSTGLGANWADIKIFEDSGIQVLQAPQISNLFAMLINKRFDYLSLSAQNANWHLSSYIDQYPDLRIEENLVVIYPFARFFFVRKDNHTLRDILLKGLIEAYNDGSLLELYKNHPFSKDLFSKTNLKNRIQIKLQNKNTSEKFNQIPKEYFFNTSMLE